MGRRALRADVQSAELKLAALKECRKVLRQKRLNLQRSIAKANGKQMIQRTAIERTNGVPSFFVDQRMFQRIYSKAPNGKVGIDGIGRFFRDWSKVRHFVESHSLDISIRNLADLKRPLAIVVHSFNGIVGMYELRQGNKYKHLSAQLEDLGNIRPAVTYDEGVSTAINFDEISRQCEIISSNIPRPYVQIAYMCRGSIIQLEEIDVMPKTIPILSPEYDAELGELFDRAHVRIFRDAYRNGRLDNQYGSAKEVSLKVGHK